MRVALDIDDTITRCPQLFSVLSHALRAAGHQVYIISYREDRGFAEEDLAEHGVVFDELILPTPEELYRSASADWKQQAAE